MFLPLKDNYIDTFETLVWKYQIFKTENIIVKDDEIIATGYNGAARGEPNCCDIYEKCPRLNAEHNSGNYGDCAAVHAEQNAMLSASRNRMIGATLYLAGKEYEEGKGFVEMAECTPCPICERMIRNAGIARIVGPQSLRTP